MADVFFKCGVCGQNLLVEEAGVGQEYECLHCQKPVRVPAPVGQVACEGCGLVLKIAPAMAGEAAQCPGCGGPVRVPGRRRGEVATATQAGERPRLKLRAEPSAVPGLPPAVPGLGAAAPGGAECPGCRAPIPPDAVICVQCGLNLKTGRKLSTATGPVDRQAAREAKERKAKLVKNLALTAVAAAILAFAVPRIWQVVFPPEPEYAQRPPTPQPQPMPQVPGALMPPMPAAPAPPAQPAAPATEAPQPPGPGGAMPAPGPGMPGPAMMMPPGLMPAAPPPPVAGQEPAPPPGLPAGAVPPPVMSETAVVDTNAGPAAPPAVPEPPKPPPLLITAEDLQRLGPLEKLTVAGVTYTNVRWTRVSPVEVFFFHSGGAASVPVARLLPVLNEQFNFEPAQAE